VQAEHQTRRRIIGWGAAAGLTLLSARAMAQDDQPSSAHPFELPTEGEDQTPALVDTGPSVNDHVIAQVTLNGQGPFRFMVDTGANASCVSRELADRLKLAPGRPVSVHTVVGQRRRDSVLVDRLEIGPRVRRNIQAPVLPMKDFQVDGVLGIDWLKGQRLVFDFEGKTLEITKSRRDAESKGRVVVPARRRSGQLTIVDADLGGRRINAMIDTGSQFSLGNSSLFELVSREYPRAVKAPMAIELISIAGERFIGQMVNLAFLRLGGLQLGNVPVVFVDMPVFKLWDLHDSPTLVLGMDLLTQFTTVAMDFGRSAVRFDVSEAMRA
jgi:clan AA aspartic protease (TIGR02281 family)